MIRQTEAIVLSTQRFRETSLIVKLYTADYGLESLIAKGVRSKRGRQRAIYLQPSAILDTVYYYKDARDLQNLTDYSPARHYQHCWQQPNRMLYAMLGVELFGGAVREVEANAELYSLLKAYLQAIDADKAQLFEQLLRFMLRLTTCLGIAPQVLAKDPAARKVLVMEEGTIEDSYSALTTEIGRYLYAYFVNDSVHVPRKDREHLLQVLFRYFAIHLQGFRSPKSLEVFKAIFSE